MESLDTSVGSQRRTHIVAIYDEKIPTEEPEKVVSEDRNVADNTLPSNSTSSEKVDPAINTAIVCNQDGDGLQGNIQCSESGNEPMLPMQLTPEIVNSVSDVIELSRVKSLDSEIPVKSFSETVDNFDDLQLIETNCSEVPKVQSEAFVMSKDQLKCTALQENRSLSHKNVDKSPILPSGCSQEIKNSSSHESNISSRNTVTASQEASILLQEASESFPESSISTRETSVPSPDSSVASPEVSVSAQETSFSSQGTSICKQETVSDENIVESKVLSCGLDLVCDNDSEEVLFEKQANVKPSGLADLNSNQIMPVCTKQKKRKRMSDKSSSSGDKAPVALSSKPEWLKPFEEGWRREVVFRKEAVTNGIRPADIYYYSPSGKKLRSMPEISQHLKDNKYLLDMNCFTFSKCAISKEPFETVRSAGEQGTRSAKSSPSQRSAQALKKSPSVSLTHVKEKLETVVAFSSAEDIQKKDLTGLPRKRHLLDEDLTGLPRKQPLLVEGATGLTRKRPSPVEDGPKNGNDVRLQPKRCKPIERNLPKESYQKLCGLNCLGSEGIAPTIPCDNCMCMFHPACIRFSATSTCFTCDTCKLQQKTDTILAPSSAPLGIPSLQPIALHPTTKQRSNASGVRGPPPLQRANVSSRAPPPFVIAPSPVPPLMLPKHFVTPCCVTTTTYQPMHSTATLNPASRVHIGSVASGGNLVQSSARSSQPTRQLRLVLPPEVVTQLNLEKPLALKINGQQLLLQPNEFIPIANGIRVLLPENLVSKSAMIVDSVNKTVTGTSRPSKSKAPINESANDTSEMCIIEPDRSPPPTGSTNSSGISSTTLKIPISSEALNGMTLTEQLPEMSTAKQPSEEVSENCLSPDVVTSTVQTLDNIEEVAQKTTQQMSVTQPPLVPENSSMIAPNSDVAESFSESHPIVIHVDSDSDLDSESVVSCEPPTSLSQLSSSVSSCAIEPTFVIVPDSSARLDTTSTTLSCQQISSHDKSFLSLTALATNLATQPLMSSCVLSCATLTVSSALPVCVNIGSFASEISEKLSVMGSVSVSSASAQRIEHLMSGPSAVHSKHVTDSAGRTDKSNESVNNVIDRQVTSVGNNGCTAVKRVWNSFGMLHAGFNAMFKIFQHLGVCDLFRAAAVCKTWHKLSKDQELWRSISFRGCRIKNWQQAAAHFYRMNTRRLDFRGMLPNCIGSCTWVGVAENLPQLRALQHVDFGQCSAEVLSVAAESLPNLRSVTAEIVTLDSSNSSLGSSCPVFDLAKLANLRELVCLKVRGVPGIVLPANSDATALHNLSHLTLLQNLSLTTLRGIEGKDFSFIGSLAGLRVLELGNCLNWTKETFGNLAKLVNLLNLRLECGGDPVDAGLGDALKKMTNLQHLELIRYFVADNLAIVFPALTHLRTFFIWPELQENEVQVGRQNSIILSAVSGMPFLQRLFWGITLDQSMTADVLNAANRQATIPFLLRGSPSSVTQSDQRVLSTRLLTIKEIVSALGERLPNTEIRVFQFPAQSHQINTR